MESLQSYSLTALLCECETWTRYRRRVKQLETFHLFALCSILGMRWQDRIKNLEVLDRAECTSIEALLIKPSCDEWDKSSEWQSSHAPSTAVWRACARYKDTVKGNLQWCGIQLKELEAADSDRSQWCSDRPSQLPPVLRTIAVKDSRQQPMNDTKEHYLLTSQQRSSNAPTAPDSALPDWVCRATRESMDDHTTRSPRHIVFFGHDRQPPNKHV